MRSGMRLSRRDFVALGAGLPVLAGRTVGATPTLPIGVFATSPDDTVELRAYAERHGYGQLTLVEGLLADIPVMRRVPIIVCNKPHSRLQTLWFTSQRIFYDETAERRALVYTTRRYSMTALAASASDLESDARIARLLSAVGASATNPGYAVATIGNGAVVREYLVELRLDG